MDRRKFNYIIRVIAGAYLIYLAYNLPKNSESTGEAAPNWIWIFVVVFIAAGAAFIISTIVGFLKDSKTDKEKEEAHVEERKERNMQSAAFLAQYKARVEAEKAARAEAAATEKIEEEADIIIEEDDEDASSHEEQA